MYRMIAGLAFVALLAVPAVGQDAKWGDIKGKVVWGDDKVPAQAPVDVTADKKACLAKGPILSEELVIDKETRGVKWTVVWLVDAENPKNKLPVHPSLAKVPAKVSFDQPCCAFEPHILIVRPGQVVEAKNSSTIPHNVNIIGGTRNPNLNQIIPAGKSLDIEGWNASNLPVSVSCSIHPWMKMFIRVIDSPYVAVTDAKGNFEIKNAPAGKFNLVVWNETNGWVVGDKNGVPITIEAGKTTEVPVTMKAK